MRLTVLGSGTCAPSATRASSGYWLEAEPLHLRLDCGAGTLHGAARCGLPWDHVSHQVITHFHIDHAGELPALLFALKHGRTAPRGEPLTLVGPAGLGALVAGAAAAFGARLLEQDFPVEVRELAPGDDALPLPGGGRLLVAKSRHTTESLAVRIEASGRSLGYTGDTGPDDGLARFFSGVDLLLAECSFVSAPADGRHLGIDDAAALAAAAGTRHLVATHMTFDPDTELLAPRLASGFAGRITIARDGLVLDV